MIERETSVNQTLEAYLDLSRRFINPPSVELTLVSQALPGHEQVGAQDISISTAVQCYAPGVAKMTVRDSERMQAIAKSTMDAGHHTTRMHAHYTWQLVGVSRSFTREIAHSNPYYNSEQQSQRYVEAKRGNYLMPAGLSPEQMEVFSRVADQANDSYFELLPKLLPVIETRMRQMYPAKGWDSPKQKERLEKKRDKIAQEVARYVLPIAQQTTYFHTLSELSLLRLYRASQMGQMSDEARFVIGKMVASLSENDPTILRELREPLEAHTYTDQEMYLSGNFEEFDALLGHRASVLLDFPTNIRSTVPFGVRNVLGTSETVLSNEDAWRLILNPSQNKLLADTFDIGILDPVTQNLRHANFVWATKLSHTGDSQRQRHRRTPGSPPPISNSYKGVPDYITPLIIREDQTLSKQFDDIMHQTYQGIEEAIRVGIDRETALTLLPNAHAVRVVESGDLFDWHHRHKQRLCYLAQEEIFFISVEQALDIVDLIPEAENAFLAPCGIRKNAGVSPRCPEGDRFCGVPVFNMQLSDYLSKRLI